MITGYFQLPELATTSTGEIKKIVRILVESFRVAPDRPYIISVNSQATNGVSGVRCAQIHQKTLFFNEKKT